MRAQLILFLRSVAVCNDHLESFSVSVYRMSSQAKMLSIDSNTVFVGHPFFTNFLIKGEYADVLTAISDDPTSAEELARRLNLKPDKIRKALNFLELQHFVLSEDRSEEEEILKRVQELKAANSASAGDFPYAGKIYRDYAPLELKETERLIPQPTKAKFLIVGGCLTQLASDALMTLAPRFGVEALTEEAFPSLMDSVQMKDPDVVIFQSSVTTFLSPLWDHAAFLSDEERKLRLQQMKDSLALSLTKIKARARGSLLLVHGFSTPLYSPLGRAEFRHTYDFYRIVQELNEVILTEMRNDPNAMFIDEERLLSAEGKRRLLDNAVSIFSHYGPIDLIGSGYVPPGPSREDTFGVLQPNHAPKIFARAYLECFATWKGIGRIKCVIVDLDNTLWPGLASESTFNLHDGTFTFSYGVLAGIHQALKLANRRGVLLAVCSRNYEEDVRKAWDQMHALAVDQGLTHLLQPEDFVIQKVNWKAKSANVAEIMSALGLAPEAVLFIDDSAIEREEVQTAFPTMRVLGENLNAVRSVLLDDYGLQNHADTSESVSRTAMVKAQLMRDAAQKEAPNELEFLRTLGARVQVTKLRTRAQIPRVVELIQRTNQFNTTLLRLGTDDVQRYIEDTESAVYVLNAGDRFTNYGLVGACVVHDKEVVSFVMSCRIIPLRAEVPFLATALSRYNRTPIRARIVNGDRNQPCRRLYQDACFDEIEQGCYLLAKVSNLPTIDQALYNVEYLDESA